MAKILNFTRQKPADAANEADSQDGVQREGSLGHTVLPVSINVKSEKKAQRLAADVMRNLCQRDEAGRLFFLMALVVDAKPFLQNARALAREDGESVRAFFRVSKPKDENYGYFQREITIDTTDEDIRAACEAYENGKKEADEPVVQTHPKREALRATMRKRLEELSRE